MTTNWIIGGVVVIAILLGGFFVFNQSAQDVMMEGETMQDDVMMEKDDAMMEKDDAMMEGDVMKKDEAMMEGDSMQKDLPAQTDEDAMMKEEGAMMEKAGSYEAYSPQKLALASEGKVVIYFHADWCPICRGLESNITANLSSIPADVHILKANYDTETALRQKYGVTYQHTFVQVDAQGNLIKKWGDATTLAAALARVQ